MVFFITSRGGSPELTGFTGSEGKYMSTYEILVVILMIAMLIIEVIRISKGK